MVKSLRCHGRLAQQGGWQGPWLPQHTGCRIGIRREKQEEFRHTSKGDVHHMWQGKILGWADDYNYCWACPLCASEIIGARRSKLTSDEKRYFCDVEFEA